MSSELRAPDYSIKDYAMGYFVRWVRKLQTYLSRWTRPHQDEMVLSLILHTASLELSKTEFVELAPTQGCCGPFKLSGNSLPVFQYTVFDKAKDMMEFVAVRVEVSKPDRIAYFAKIDAERTSDPKRHGEVVVVKQKYKEPFEKLSLQLFQYFPFYKKVQRLQTQGDDTGDWKIK